MKITLRSVLALPLLLSISVANAQPGFCWQESTSQFGDTQTCIENLSLPSDVFFDQVCISTKTDLVTITSRPVNACPPNYAGVCKGLTTQTGLPIPYLSYLYENDLQFMKNACQLNGGTWDAGGD